eukprot:TRINITY_DN6796_c0_g1_i1.p1 TRINITY_DN6796_c0_g1~~TRINITY_DN6796_c0_g1_i1.p1  ORF type:complete len:385 (-),score=90.46 TRINITY_DN6796_c0_g1_i1:51-1172(-)
MGDVPAFVFDTGSGWVKAGLANAPECFRCPSLAGVHVLDYGTVDASPMPLFGADVEAVQGGSPEALEVTRPVNRGSIANWDFLEQMMLYAWNESQATGERFDVGDTPIVFCDTPLTPAADRERVVSLLFEKFNAPAVYIDSQAALALNATGSTTGLVLDTGFGVTSAVPICDGRELRSAIARLNFGGYDVDQLLASMLRLPFDTVTQLRSVSSIKEATAYAALEFYAEAKLPPAQLEKTYALPDGGSVKVRDPRFRCAEAVFHPDHAGRPAGTPGVHRLCYNAAAASDPQFRKALLENIVLVGGNSLFPGFVERLQKEVSCLANTAVKVVTPKDRQNATWTGACVIANLSSFAALCATRDEYDESGSGVASKF